MTVKTASDIKSTFRIKDNNEPGWLYGIRNDAWNKFDALEMPERIEHLWKYSDPMNFDLVDIENHLKLGKRNPRIVDPEELGAENSLDAYWVAAEGNDRNFNYAVTTSNGGTGYTATATGRGTGYDVPASVTFSVSK